MPPPIGVIGRLDTSLYREPSAYVMYTLLPKHLGHDPLKWACFCCRQSVGTLVGETTCALPRATCTQSRQPAPRLTSSHPNGKARLVSGAKPWASSCGSCPAVSGPAVDTAIHSALAGSDRIRAGGPLGISAHANTHCRAIDCNTVLQRQPAGRSRWRGIHGGQNVYHRDPPNDQ